MQSFFRKIKSLRLVFLFGIFFCLTVCSFAQTSIIQKSQSEDEKLLRTTIIKIESSPGAELAEDFTYTTHRIDLNNDGREEVVVWIPEDNMGGTSGYPILILTRTTNGYRKVMDIDQGWTPVIALNSKRNGWRDIAFLMGGGGAEWYYFIYQHKGKTYKYTRMQKKQPRGEILIEKNWQHTFFGPMPK